jgi:CheY-like chemotaxis protein
MRGVTMTTGRILIVDPHRRDALDLQQRVTQLGHTVLAIATSGPEALDSAEALRPDVVLMEVRLPGPTDAFQAGTQIWMRLGTPVIYVSAHFPEVTLRRLWPTAMAGLLGKHVGGRALREALEEVLNARPASTPRWPSTVERWRPHPSPAVIEPHTEALSEGQRPAGEGRDMTTPLRILMAEDERIIGADLRRCLRRMGHTVVGIVASGEEAIAHAHRCQPDLVLMDIRLRGPLDGVEAAEHIRTQLDIPVVFMTAYTTVQTLQRVWRTRPAGYLSKPFDESQLCQALQQAVETRRPRTRPKRPRP